mmetsp:Transcript_79622/g.161930  ORF Transcript_79622/g.161930 Transcript_79622/m.161930 type:complete len:354 (-) Transcript_79622:755-1816(-)
MRQQRTHDGVARFVVGDELLRSVVLQRSSLQARNDAIRGIIDFIHGDGRLVAPSRKDGRLVHQILQVSTAEAGSSLGDFSQSGALSQFLVTDVHVEDLLPALHVRQAHGHATIKSPWPQQGVVQDVRTIGRCHHDDTAVAFEAIHFSQDLIEGLLPLIISTTHASTSLSSNSINLINENNAGRLLLGLLEDIADARSSNPNEEFDEFGGRGLDERHSSLTCQSLGHQSLSGAGRASEQDTTRNLCTDLHKALRSFQKVNDLHQLLLCFIDASYVLKLHTSFRLDHDLCLALVSQSGNATSTSTTSLGAQEEQACNGQEWKGHIAQRAEKRVWLLRLMDVDGNILVDQLGNDSC